MSPAARVDDLWRLGVRALAEGIRARSWSAAKVLASVAGRIEQVDGDVRAWAALDLDRAARDAAVLDGAVLDGAVLDGAVLDGAAVDEDLDERMPLRGVPFGIKDVFLTRGLRTGMGSPLFDGFVPGEDAGAVTRLRSAGGLILGKTATTAFAGADPAPTANPWKPGRTPGGSSSGSAAAVACGMVPAALGTQTAGSVLRPAAFCGVVGFKPTFGAISTDGVFPYARSVDTVGIIARSADDVACVFDALAQPGPAAPSGTAGAGSIRLRLLDLGGLVSSPDISAHASAIARRLASHGAAVTEARLPVSPEEILAAHSLIMHVEGASVHARRMRASRELYGPGWQATTDLGQLIPAVAYEKALRLRRELSAAVDEWLAPDDLLILPTVGAPVPDMGSTGDTALQALFTFLGLPAATLPTGFSADGLPRGTQVVAGRHQDHRLLAAATWMQQVLDYPVVFPLD